MKSGKLAASYKPHKKDRCRIKKSAVRKTQIAKHTAAPLFLTGAGKCLAALMLLFLLGLFPVTEVAHSIDNQARPHTMPTDYRNAAAFNPMDFAIQDVGDGGYIYKMPAAPYRVYFPGWLDSPVTLFSEDKRCQFTLEEMSYNAGEAYLGSPVPVLAEIDDETVIYPEVFENVDVEYQLTPHGIKEFFVLNQRPPAPDSRFADSTLDFTQSLFAEGLSMYVDGVPAPDEFTTHQPIELVDEVSGDTIFTLPAPYAVDAAGDIIQIRYSVQFRENSIRIHTQTPYAWLVDPDRAYPVKIEPSVTLDADYSITLIDNSSWDDGFLGSGDFDEVYRSGIDFDTTSIPDTATITKVELKIYIDDEYGPLGNDVGNMTKKAFTYHDTDNDKSGFWSDADGNQYLSNSSGFDGEDSYHTVELLSAAATDLEDQLGANWFSVGWTETTEADKDGRDGHHYDEANPPQLIVTYTDACIGNSITASPATVTEVDDGTCEIDKWDNIDDATAQDDTWADIDDKKFDTGDISARLDLTNFSFDLPTGATIDGVKVEIDRYAEDGEMQDEIVRLMLAGSPDTTQNKALTSTAWPSSDTDTYQSYGGATDKWGISSLSESDVENSGFGATLCVEALDKKAAYVDHAQITVYYSLALSSVGNSPSPSSVSDTSTHTVSFTTASTLPDDGKIAVTFPAGFDLTAVGNSDISSGTMDGSFTVSRSGQELTITRSGGTDQSAAAENIIIADITNTATVGTSYTVDVETQTSCAVTIDGPTTSSAFTVKGKSALAAPDTQVVDQLADTNGTQPTDVELVGFKITPTGENLTWTDLVISLTYGGGMADADIINAEIYVDNGTVGTYESGTDTQVGSQSANASGGALTWDTVGGTVSAATNYLIIFDAGAALSTDETVRAAVAAANITVTGATSSQSITTSGSTVNGPLHTVTALLTLADHAAGQEPNRLEDDAAVTGEEFFAFQLTNSTGATATQNGFVFQLSSVTGMVQGDFDNFYIYVDADGSGDIEGGETTKVCATEGTTAIAAGTGTITFSGCGYDITDSTTVKMVLTGDLANLATGDTFIIDLGTGDLTPEANGSDCTTTTHTAGIDWYYYRKKIIIDKDFVGSSCSQDLTDFPVMVKITGSDFDEIANDVDADGYDIIFKDAELNQLAHEIEEYDEITDNRLVAWVRVPTIYWDSDTTIWVYYGNPSVTTATENPAGVWDADFVSVYHLSHTSGNAVDSVDNFTADENFDPDSNMDQTGIASGADYFDGSDYLGTNPEWALTGAHTYCAWVKFSTTGSNMVILEDGGTTHGDGLGITSAGNFRYGAYWSSTKYNADSAATYADGNWHYVCGVKEGGSPYNMHLYVDGGTPVTIAGANNDPGSNDARIGTCNSADPVFNTGTYFTGYLDEIRISDSARDACWIETEYNNIDAPATFYSISSERIEAAAATAVDLLTFMATGEGEAVNVAWKTAAEIDNKGFHLYRADTYEGPFERLTDKLIPGAGFMTQTRAYNFMDAGVTRGKLYYYQLEDIDIRGKKTQHGPVCVDWDGDGIPDDWEQAFGLDPDLDDAEQDPDKDGLSNYQEYLRGSDPRDADSDGDGIIDGEEAWKLEGREAEGSRLLGRGVEIVSEDAEGLVLELRTSGFEAESVTGDDGREYARLRIEDYIHGHTNEIGRPQLPVKGILLDMPPGKSARISVLETDEQHYGGYLVYPVPEQIDETRRAAHGPAEVFVIDETFYFHDENYPAITAGTGRRYVFRGQAKHQILFYPLAFNPAFGDLTLYSRIRLRVDYVDSTLLQQGGPQPVAWQAPVKDNGLTPDSMLASMNLASLAAPGLTAPLSPVLSPARMLVSALWSPFSDGDPEDVTAYKILTSAEGIYRLTAADLAAAGIDTAAMDLSLIRLYYQGTEAAVYIHDADSDDTLDAGDYILFYGQAADSIYAKFTESAVFWLTLDGGEGVPKRMSTIDAAPAGGTAATDFTDTVRHETDALYGGTAPGSDSVDRWFFATYIPGDGWDPAWVPNAGDLIDFDVALPGALDTGTVTIELFATFDQDHEITVAVNGTGYGTVVWSGIDYKRISLENVPLADGTNTVSLACSSGEDTILLDWIAVDYERNFAADGNSLKFSHGADYRYTVSNLNSSALMVFDISDASDVGRVSGAATTGSGPYSLEFEPQTDADRTQTYLVVTDATIMSPDSIVADVGGDLGSTDNGADYILITHRDLGWDGNGDAYDWLTDLIDLRQAQGLRVKVVDVADIYDEFSYGHVTPRAVRDFLAYAYGSWTAPAPRYVLLVGDHTYDYKNINGGGAENFVPAWLAYTDYMGETVTDEYFGRISGDDAVPDLYIGRLPAKSTAEAAIMVQKIIDYEQATNTKTWQKDTLLVADDRHQDYERIFEVINEDAAGTLPAGMNDPARAYLNQYVVARDVTADIKSGFDNGALIVNYSGHGATQLWASERIFDVSNAWPGYYADVDDLAELSEADRGRYPFVVSMSCLSGYFAGLGAWENPSLMEALLRAENKGAAATLMPTGETTTEGQHILNSALFEALFTDDIRRLGPAVTAAKQTLLANGGSYYEQVSETFLLFGDPAMELKVPLPRRPAGLTAGLTDAAAVVLSWNSATDANGNAVAGYHVYRSTTAGSGFIQLTAVPVTDTAYSDDSVNAGTTYYYTVRSVDDDGDQSVPSAAASVTLTDSDSDGLPDVMEAAGCTESGTSDSDGDGLADGTEDANQNGTVDDGETDPCNADSDGDGLPDGWEYENGLNALYDGGSAGTNGDADGDGWTNYQEYLSCSAPDDADSLPSAPTAPAVNYPADDGESDSLQPQLSVSNATDPDCQDLRYVFEVYADAQLTSLVAATDAGGIAEDTNTTAWQVPGELADNTAYFWRARAYDGINYSDWMATAEFFVNTTAEAPTVPVVSRPPHESEVTVLQPTLQVVNATDADGDTISYTFSVYADETLSVPVTAKTGVVQGTEGTTAWQVNAELEDNTSYWWTVQAKDDEGLTSDWSPAAEFFINTFNDPPGTPAGGSPDNGAEVTTVFPQLGAAHATDPDYDDLSYFFEIDTAATFDSFELEQSAEIAQQSGDTTTWMPQELMDNTTYHWRVRAYDGMAYGDWLKRSFFVNTENDAPQAPVIDHPGDQSEVTSLLPTLAVKAAVDADNDELEYNFELYGDDQLSAWIGGTDGPDTAWQVEEVLEDNRSYYWRARAEDAHAETGPWSQTASFFVNTANDPPETPVLNNPLSGGTDTSLTPTLSVFNADDPDRDALRYEFELYADPDLTLQVKTAMVDQGHLITAWTVPVVLDDRSTYYWRVRADDGQITGAWMPTAVIEINTAGADTRYEIESRSEVSAGSTNSQAVTVSSADSPIYQTAVQIPPGALRRNCTISIGDVTNPPALPARTRAVGRVFEFGPSGQVFAAPLVIKLPYTAAAVKQARVADTTELAVFYYDPSLLAWVEVAIDSIDSENRTVSIRTNHFSMYTIAAPVAAAGGGGGGAGCFISTLAGTGDTLIGTGWTSVDKFGLLALLGLLWLGRRKRRR